MRSLYPTSIDRLYPKVCSQRDADAGVGVPLHPVVAVAAHLVAEAARSIALIDLNARPFSTSASTLTSKSGSSSLADAKVCTQRAPLKNKFVNVA